VLLVSTDPASNLDEVLETKLTNAPTPIVAAPGLDALNINPVAAAAAYRERLIGPMRGLLPEAALRSMEEQLSGSCTVEIAAFDEFSGFIGDPNAAKAYDHVIFDTAPTGHTLRLVKMPELMDAWIRALTRSRRAMLGVEGDDKNDPILLSLKDRFERLQGLRARLMSGRTSAFVLVLIPERLPIEETARALAQLDDTGVKVGGLVVNRVLPRETTDAFLAARREQEQVYLDEIATRFASRPRVYLPQFRRDVYGLASLGPVADALAAATGVSA
jgi:arsenite-transporting ATPase